MKRAMISIHVFVSLPDEVNAAALARDIREFADHACQDYYALPARSTTAVDEESDSQRAERELKMLEREMKDDARRI